MPPAEAPPDLPLALQVLREELGAIARGFDLRAHALEEGERAARQGDLLRSVDRYLRLEEETLLPLLRRSDFAHEDAVQSHCRLRAALQRAREDSSEASLAALKDVLEAHRGEQERNTWPRAAELLGEELPALALEMEERRQRLRGAYDV
jgi:hypothetical protein